MSSTSHQQGSQQLPATSATQYKVARIVEIGEDVERHDELIFDMRDCSSSSFHGSVHVVHHFIGDSSDESMDVCKDLCCFDGAVRTVLDVGVESCADVSEDLHSILIGSGADASIFPSSLFNKDTQVSGSVGRLCDAQGVEIPVTAVQDMEIRLEDVTNRTVLLRERVALSDRVSQPIISFGHLLESGWGIDATEQTLSHSVAGAHIPLELQSKSVVVQGTIRLLSLQEPNNACLHVRAIQAEVNDDVATGAVGWELDSRGCGVGRHYADKFQDPLMVKPDIPAKV
eukprot:s792_g29.t1